MSKILKGHLFEDQNKKVWTFVRAYLNEDNELYMLLSDGYTERHIRADEFDQRFKRVGDGRD